MYLLLTRHTKDQSHTQRKSDTRKGKEGDAPKHTTDSSESLDELRTLLTSVRDELELGSEVLVLFGEPLEQRLGLLRVLHLKPGRLVHELGAVLLGLLGRGVDDDLLCEPANVHYMSVVLQREREIKEAGTHR